MFLCGQSLATSTSLSLSVGTASANFFLSQNTPGICWLLSHLRFDNCVLAASRPFSFPQKALYLNVEEGVEVWNADVFVFHLAAHVLNGMNGCFVVTVGLWLEGKVLYPAAANLMEFAEHCTSQLHCFYL